MAVPPKPSAERAALVGTLLPLMKDAFDAVNAEPPTSADLYYLLENSRDGFQSSNRTHCS